MSGPSIAEMAQATGQMYWLSAVEATKSLRRNWIIIPASFAASVIFFVAYSLLGGIGFAGGLFIGLLQIALISLYYSWISETINREKLKLKDIVVFDYSLFSTTISVAFILFIAQFIISSLINGLGVDWIMSILGLAILLLFNALPEVIYVHRYEGMYALGQAERFTRENWIEWYLPFVVLLAPLIAINPIQVLDMLSGIDALLPAMPLVHVAFLLFPPYGTGALLLGLLVGVSFLNWFMLFRGVLFKELETGTRRQRIYRAKQR